MVKFRGFTIVVNKEDENEFKSYNGFEVVVLSHRVDIQNNGTKAYYDNFGILISPNEQASYVFDGAKILFISLIMADVLTI
jgi:hypothetical protein